MKKLLLLPIILIGITANAKTYYVSTLGSDSQSGTNAGTPWLTIAKVNATTLHSGDSVLFNKSSTWTGTTLIPSVSGVIYSTYGFGSKPLIDGGANYALAVKTGNSLSSVIVDGIAFERSGAIDKVAFLGDAYNNLLMRYFTIKNCVFYGGFVIEGSYNLFINNKVDGSTNDGDGNGVWECYDSSHHNTYRFDTICNFSIRGIWTMIDTHDGVFDQNVIYNTNCGIDLDGANNVVYNHTVSNNTIYNASSIAVECENGFNCNVTGNYMYNGGRNYIHFINYSLGVVRNGFGATNCIGMLINSTVSNNVMNGGGIGNGNGFTSNAIEIYEAGGINIYNNTVYSYKGNFVSLGYTDKSQTQGIKLVNNVFSVVNSFTTLGMIQFSDDSYSILAADDNNCLYNNGDSNFYSGQTTYQSLSLNRYRSLTGNAMHSISVNPQFVSSSNLHLTVHSPCVNTGKSIGLPYIGNAPDMGAYEYINIPPVSNAGQDQTITLPVNSLTLSGSGTDADGSVVAYLWTKASGPSGGSISNPTLASTQLTGLTQGIYLFALKVTDNNGASSSDTMQVTVNRAPNQLPVANAGADVTITLPANAVTITGSGNDPDGNIINYLWTKISGPANYTITNPSSDVTNITGLVQGVYQFQLRVMDNDSATGNDVMILTVNAALNKAPVAFAGADQSISLPVNSVILSGSGNDSDGTVISYSWIKNSGPNNYTITNPSSAVTSITGLVSGVYQFELDVTDNDGAIGKDVVQITVNAPANMPPVANAGADQSITLPVNSVSLSGSGTDVDGNVVSYLWTKISGPSNFIIANDTLSNTNVTGLSQGVYQFQLTVTDNDGAVATDIVQVTVTSHTNKIPVANAGANQSINLPLDSTILSGSGVDSDGVVISYNWAMLSGPTVVNITNQSSPVTSITGLSQGVYQFELSVTDNDSATGTSIVQVVVNAAVNTPPTANAGANQNITLPVNSVTLSGNGSDKDGVIINYLWTKISGPASYTITNSISPVTQVGGLIQGAYQFQLQVTDNNGATATSIMQVVVNSSLNIPPTANAGVDQNITLPVNSTTLSGSGNDSDGTVVSYLWTKISGPGGYTLEDSNAAVTNVTGLFAGVYQFQLQVTDNNGATGTDIVQVTVNAPVNIPPVAHAGTDQVITLPTDSILLSGSGSDPDGNITNYGWIEISGPSAYTVTNSLSAVTSVTGLVQGIYNFGLQVTDNDGAITTDTMQVTVNAAINIPPTANAGADQTITLPQNSVLLTGSGTDENGVIVSYAWSEISGPAVYTISNASSAATNVTNLVQGVYKFELTVTDNKGAIGNDTVIITVNAANNMSPIANAGANQTITLPANSVTLSGTGSDPDGTVAAYLWTKISGPSAFSIVTSSSAVSNVTGLVQGIYQFQLSVTDNIGATTTAVVQITVNALPNQPPVVSAGADQTITLPLNSISAAGIATDADGTIVSYLWVKISGPSSYLIENATSATTSITALKKGTYRFMLRATDNDGASSTSVMKVIVKDAPNLPPVANAGSDIAITLPVNSLTLSGSGTDADGSVVSYSWAKISGPSSYTILNPTSANTGLAGLSAGVYQFQLQVTDNDGAIGTDNIQITVNKAANKAPTANAGADQSINLPANTVTLSGSGSDSDGTIASYTWTKVSGPASYTFTDSTSALIIAGNLKEGIYQFQLKVTDNDGAIGTDIIQVTVNAAPNQPPVANAGSDQSITLPKNNVLLSGSGTDPDGTIASYVWTKISGPASYAIANASSASTLINNLTQGTYQFQLKVTDNDGATSTDIVQITVNAALNIPPVANAGGNQTITVPANSVTLHGSGTDADGTVVSYLWTKISGPSNYIFNSSSAATTNVSGLSQGIYQFQLSVTDNGGATSTDVMQVTVNAAPNKPPVANAGTDQSITLPQNSVALNGYGTDEDGSVVSYSWVKISGPSQYAISNPSSSSTTVTGVVQGSYQFELKVTDNSGATSSAIMQVTVNAAANKPPTANAGQDQSITLPANSVTVSGSGADADGTIVNYTWSQISGPSYFNIVNASLATTNITGLTQGIYKFELKVTDNNGASGNDTITVIVNPAANIPPTVNAGADQTLILPVNSTTLAGTANDVDGYIKSYLWSKISGPSNYSIVNINSPVTDIWNLSNGIYTLELKVTDNSGASVRDTIQISVMTPNTPPIANAGADQTITLPQNSVTLYGSGTDSSGVITNYSWVQLTGPSVAVIVSPFNDSTTINSLVGGNYQFELTLTDNNGNIGKDTVIISVAEPRLNVDQNFVIKLYPNPVIDQATLTINTSEAQGSLNVVVANLEGKVLYKNTFGSGQNSYMQQINFTSFASGVYIITVYKNNEKIKSLKIVKM